MADIRLVTGCSLSEFRLRFKLRNVGRAENIKEIMRLTIRSIEEQIIRKNKWFLHQYQPFLFPFQEVEEYYDLQNYNEISILILQTCATFETKSFFCSTFSISFKQIAHILSVMYSLTHLRPNDYVISYGFPDGFHGTYCVRPQRITKDYEIILGYTEFYTSSQIIQNIP